MGRVEAIFDRPQHPYTRMLIDAIPKMHDTGRARTPVQGEVPNPLDPPPGCSFHPQIFPPDEHLFGIKWVVSMTWDHWEEIALKLLRLMKLA